MAKENTLLPSSKPLSWLERLGQRALFKLLSQLHVGRLVLTQGTQQWSFGQQDQSEPIELQIHDPKFYQYLVLRGSIGISEAYMQAYWSSPNLVKLIELVIQNHAVFQGIEGKFSLLEKLRNSLGVWLLKNDLAKAKENVLKHYDLGNDMFELFLDKSMMYSCAVYPEVTANLQQASEYKLGLICDKLALKSTDHLLEIGTGWGGLACYAAKHYGCKVTTTTISDKQYEYAKKRFNDEGVSDRVELLNVDYRELTGQYDKLVSVEMIEAISYKNYDSFFETCDRLLKEDGLMLIQAIIINDQNYERAKNEIDFIRKYIFPGGCLPSIARMSQAILDKTQCHLLNLETIGEYYVTTLMDWRKGFLANHDKIIGLGFSEDFIRTWDYYFCYCAAAFNQGYINDIQAVWRKKSW